MAFKWNTYIHSPPHKTRCWAWIACEHCTEPAAYVNTQLQLYNAIRIPCWWSLMIVRESALTVRSYHKHISLSLSVFLFQYLFVLLFLLISFEWTSNRIKMLSLYALKTEKLELELAFTFAFTLPAFCIVKPSIYSDIWFLILYICFISVRRSMTR